MKRLMAIATTLALLCSAFSVTPALAWHVESGDCRSKPVGRIIEPAGDPWGRIIVKHDRSCRGWVRVPDEDWVDGGTFHIAGKVLRAGDRAWLAPGTYEGSWSNFPETERVVIRDTAGPVRVVWRGVGRHGMFKLKYEVPNRCVLKTGWHFLQPETLTWVQDHTNGQRLATKRVAKAGWYGKLYKGYFRGITCPWGYNPE
jgi:hypothetical protein